MWVSTEPPSSTGWLTWTSTFFTPVLSSGFSNVWGVSNRENENEADQGPQTERDSRAGLEVPSNQLVALAISSDAPVPNSTPRAVNSFPACLEISRLVGDL